MRAGSPIVPTPRVTYAAAAPDMVDAVHVRSEKTRGIDGLLQNLDRDLSPMRMARKQQIIALPGRHWEDVRIVRQQDVHRARRDQPLRAHASRAPASAW